MKRFVISLVLVVMAVFSLSAVETKNLKVRYDDSSFEGRARVLLNSITDNDLVYYDVEWWELDGSDVVSVYKFSSLERAFNVWNMSRYEIQSTRQFLYEDAEILDDNRLYLVKHYLHRR